jgi:phosphoribosylformylglycinamidine cyclo-ligase
MAITYRDAGVDIDAGEELVRRIGPLAKATRIAEVLADVGGFAGLCRVPSGLAEPILVSGTDGVGTKLEVAFATGVHDTIGLDLVAMCVNDVLTTGARPLFFLDYFASGRLDVDVAEAVIRGIARGCTDAGCALLGGETAELPGMYEPGKYDLAGFAVGIVDRSQLLDGSRVTRGDVLVGVASSGLHSNGYSLARRVLFGSMKLDYAAHVAELGCTVAEALLRPTRIYARAVASLMRRCGEGLHALAHVTGGGMTDNVPRVIPSGLAPRIELASYERPPLFELLAAGGPIEEAELRRTFNLGVGLVAVVAREAVGDALDALTAAGENAWILGDVTASDVGDTQFV